MLEMFMFTDDMAYYDVAMTYTQRVSRVIVPGCILFTKYSCSMFANYADGVDRMNSWNFEYSKFTFISLTIRGVCVFARFSNCFDALCVR